MITEFEIMAGGNGDRDQLETENHYRNALSQARSLYHMIINLTEKVQDVRRLNKWSIRFDEEDSFPYPSIGNNFVFQMEIRDYYGAVDERSTLTFPIAYLWEPEEIWLEREKSEAEEDIRLKAEQLMIQSRRRIDQELASARAKVERLEKESANANV